MLDFLQGARGQDFHDITLMVDGEPIGAHKVRYQGYCHSRVSSVTLAIVCGFCENKWRVWGSRGKEKREEEKHYYTVLKSIDHLFFFFILYCRRS